MAEAPETKIGGDLWLRGKLGAAASVAVRKAKADAIAADLAPHIQNMRASGVVTHKDIADGLNRMGARTSRGGSWSASSVWLLLVRIGRAA